ncbi:hypothetical protein EOD42_14450 [Rhodovarius crocodyli]|uniref:TolA protein n=1 Tax=Rhodovarius crocodyli TaxID=1979269 RepID=A0A437MF74_9PROT|nr:hypothetical protein [Rhodovarius crocodyli]RVT96308.1 hypothetical protein EOD42_14450 [Rhodovarius crocodyli]
MSEATTPAVIQLTEPKDIILDAKKREDFYKQITATIAGQDADLATEKGRKAVASLAHQVAKAKVAVDNAGKALTEDARKQVQAINTDRNAVVAKLEDLQKLARRPLDEWEAAAAKRKAERESILTQLAQATQVGALDTAEVLRRRLAIVEGIGLDATVLEDATAFASKLKQDAIDTLTVAITRAEAAEKAQAELEELRRVQAERDAADRQREQEAAAQAAEAERLRVEQEREELAKLRRADEERKAAEAANAPPVADAKPGSEPPAAAPAPSVAPPIAGCYAPGFASAYVRPQAPIPLPPASGLGAVGTLDLSAPIAAEMAETAARALQREVGFSPAACLRVVTLIRDGKIPHLTFG